MAARTRSVISAAVAFHSNWMEISTSGYDVIRAANLRRSGVATIQPSNRLLWCLPAATTAASSSALRSRGIVSESKIVIGTYHYRGSDAMRPASAMFGSAPLCR